LTAIAKKQYNAGMKREKRVRLNIEASSGKLLATEDVPAGAMVVCRGDYWEAVFDIETDEPYPIGQKAILCTNRFAPDILMGSLIVVQNVRTQQKEGGTKEHAYAVQVIDVETLQPSGIPVWIMEKDFVVKGAFNITLSEPMKAVYSYLK
jgi:hypothetical protein